ncbi:MAG: hypothetical protein NT058_01820, partial [Candidatus Portnoybacteria bacterium]|nr:hypothetical protein [Candidatus Portnoybacteria bacterium]
KEAIAFSDKNFLMPNGDYLPYVTKLFLNLYSFNTDMSQKFFSRGDSRVAKTAKGNIGGSICTGFMSPDTNRKMTKDGAEILISASSDAPFHGSQNLLRQIMAMTKFRAIENRRYFGQATNMGYSFLIDSKGKFVEKSSTLGIGILFTDAKLLNIETTYTKLGDWVVFVAVFVLLSFLFICLTKNAIINRIK